MIKSFGKLICLGTIVFLLTGCKGSEDIQGEWQGVDASGNTITMKVSESTITISSDQEKQKIKYKQRHISTNNEQRTYGVSSKEGKFSFIFPDKSNTKEAFFMRVSKKIKQEEYYRGTIEYVLSKNGAPDYNHLGYYSE